MNEINLPSGDQRGLEWEWLPRVSWSSDPSARLVSIRFETLRPFSSSIVPFTHRSQRPSGEILYSAADSSNRMSLTVQAVSLEAVSLDTPF
jgi:hypothetical protein